MVKNILLFKQAIDKTIGLRLSEEEEEIGADILEHGINNLFRGMALSKRENKEAVNTFVQQNESSAEFRNKLMQFFSEMALVSDK